MNFFAKLAGGKFFTKLDMTNAYLQLPLDPDSKQYVTINTQKGLFQYDRLPFGVASAPAIFQRYMDTLLQGIQGVSIYLDDILNAGATVDKNLKTLETVLKKLEDTSLRLNCSKCFFCHSSLEYLGHIISEQGIQPTADKVHAIKDAPPPSNLTELRAFLGLLNYYSKFLPNLSSQLAPLYSLLCKNRKWHWGPQQREAFHAAQNALQAESLLVHYNPSKPIILSCDASPYGKRAVLSHVMADNQNRPITYVSRTLSCRKTIGEGGLDDSVCCKKISQLYIWAVLSHRVRPSTPDVPFRGQEWHSSISVFSYTTVGTHTILLHVQNSL